MNTLICRKLRYEKDLLDMTWRLNFNDIQRQLYAGMGHCSQVSTSCSSTFIKEAAKRSEGCIGTNL